MGRTDSSETRRRILEAAARMIHRGGYVGTSIDAVVAKVGVTKGAFFHYFPSKKHLVKAVLAEVYRDAVAGPRLDGIEASDDPIAALTAEIDVVRAGCDEASVRLGCPVRRLAEEVAASDEELRRELDVLQGERLTRLETALERGKVSGTVRSAVDSRAAAVFIQAAIDGAWSQAKVARDPALLSGALGTLRLLVQTLRPGIALKAN